MTIYIDLLFLLNFTYDFLLLLTVKMVLKRNNSLKSITLASIFGALSLVILFLHLNNILLFLFKILSGFIMSFIAFGYHNLKTFLYNNLYLYMCSVILAGFLYFLDLEFSNSHHGLIFYFNGISINYLLLIIIAPIILYIYIWQNKKLKQKQNYYYNLTIVLKNNSILDLTGYLDTGNNLKDPITHKYIIIVEKKSLSKIRIRSPIYVPYNSINYHGLLKCFSPKYILINNKTYNNYLIGIYEGTFNLDGINCLLNYKLKEDLNV
jgi:stage II sporulation protein GA (sporulation sigma-E factor processing peptidase)